MVKCEFLFDFGSPNSYLAWKVLPGIEERTGVRFDYVPVLLGGIFKATGNSSPAVAFAGVKGKMAYEMLEMRRFISKHGLTAFKMNPHFPVNTLHLMRGAIFARQQNLLPAYMDAVMHHMWEEPKKMDEPDVIMAALAESGLDASAILEGAQDAGVKAALLENTEKAVARGVFGAPSFFVGDELFFGKDRLSAVEEEILAQSA
ncbi:2-hydroxychromene-2-carboxylate isomerase [Kordiimonas gwangyangensis]|uniref:2-hydroxychromene-2-carboxylate isomerase n=1 Tax=Kordiimonas gwangyangensis TaxID=288022 RepID=UPI00036671FF|nr:2-hydroxychromene-2-carboxylate isomerase [Kordiimonas gwangyangensis]